MAGLFHTMNIGSESLFTNRQGVDTTAHNIANAQTEGYSRQRVKVGQRDPTSRYNIIIGNGVFADGIWRAHNQFIETQLGQAMMREGSSQARQSSIKDIELIFSPELSASIADEISGFFSALQDLSVTPDDLTARNVVIQQGQNVSAAFRKIDKELKWLKESANETILEETQMISNMLETVGKLNIKIRALENDAMGTANDLRDQRDLTIRELSQRMDLHYYEDKHGMMVVRGPGDRLLVEGGHFASFKVIKNAENGMYSVMTADFEGEHIREIGSKIEGGSLHGLLDIRDNLLTSLLGQNNELATSFVSEVNDIHKQGYGVGDFSDRRGRNFFEPVQDPSRAAVDFAISTSILSNTDAIAASSTINSPGDNVIVNALVALKDKKVLSGGEATFVDFYANIAGNLGIEAVRANHTAEADKLLVSDLNSRRESVSGVSLDEEAANMIKWQTAFTASSKLITTVDEMLETVLTLKR